MNNLSKIRTKIKIKIFNKKIKLKKKNESLWIINIFLNFKKIFKNIKNKIIYNLFYKINLEFY